ncbi:hypothetical protein C0J52_23925 [Blattella germanica]|nr:hypothetical protein C0J52_23925 [Blattella germanica]
MVVLRKEEGHLVTLNLCNLQTAWPHRCPSATILLPVQCNFTYLGTGKRLCTVAKHNIYFKASCVKTLFETMLSTVHAESWKNTCNHVKKYERFYWERAGLLDELTDKSYI